MRCEREMETMKKVQRPRRKTSKTARPGRGLAREYQKYFVPALGAVDRNSNQSLEQPSMFKAVPSVVTYGISEPPAVVFENA
jgi:hypothetical protein